jgi:hypothetical protein
LHVFTKGLKVGFKIHYSILHFLQRYARFATSPSLSWHIIIQH